MIGEHQPHGVLLSSTPGLNGNEALCCRVLMGMKPTASDRSNEELYCDRLNLDEVYTCQRSKNVKFL